MDQESRIRDTSAQDSFVAGPTLAARRRRKLVIGIVSTLVLIVSAGWVVGKWSSGGRSYDSSRLRIAEVKRGDLVRDITADGRVIASNSPTLYAVAAGTVTLRVVAGDAVKKDQALAVIESPELLSRLVQEESTMASMEAEATRAMLDVKLARLAARKVLDQAMVERTVALRDLERYQRAYDGGAVPQNDLAKAQDDLKKADIGYSNAQQSYELESQGAELDARNKRILADRQRAVVAELRRQVDRLTLRAPFDGQVGQVQIAQGANVEASRNILSVVDLSKFEVEIKVPESFARDLGIGMPAQISTGGRTYPAELSAVSPEVVGGEVNARIRFAEGAQPLGLRQNQRLSVRIVMDTRRDVLMVERGPFLEQGGGNIVYVVDAGGSAVRRSIKTGAASLNAVEVIEGLQPGERVVISGSELFENAERVLINQ